MALGERLPDPGGAARDPVPDDARDLEHDVRALARERRALRRRARWRRRLLTRRGRPGVSGLLVLLVLAAVAAVASLAVVLHPALGNDPPARPLADPAVPPGAVGGLLPDGPVTTPAGSTTTRALSRPGVLVLVPVPCGCERVVGRVVDVAVQVTRSVRLVSTGAEDPGGAAVTALRTAAARGLATSGVDERGVLSGAYGRPAPGGVHVVVVGGDGVVVDVVRHVRDDRRLDAAVGRLQAHERAAG